MGLVMASPISILLVDDDTQTHSQLQVLLRDYEVSVYQVMTEADVLIWLKCSSVAIALIDIFLPDEFGYVILDAIRRQSLGASSAILATTPYYTLDTKCEVLYRGFDGYILKPFYLDEFVPYLKRAVQAV